MEDHSSSTSLTLENARLRKLLKESEIQREKERFLLQKLDLFSENTPMAVINWDLNSGITDWNKSAEIIFGYTKEDAFGKMAADFMLPESAKNFTHEVWKSLCNNTGGTRSTNENIRKDGKVITCEWYNTPLTNEKGDVVGITTMALDITEKINSEKVIKESNARFKMLSDLSFEGILIHKDGVVIEVNSSLEKLTQYSREEIIGNNGVELLVVDEYIPTILENIKKNLTTPYELELKRKDGTNIWVEIEAENFYYDGQDVRAAAIRDVSLRKENDQKLQKALYEAQESERLKSAFLSTISHELRTPLNAVIGFSDLIDKSMSIDEAVSLSKMIFDSGNHLLKIINDIFDLSVLEEGTIVLLKEKHNLYDLLDEVLEHSYQEKRKMGKANLKLSFDIENKYKDLIIVTDHKRFKQILIHLIKNALKYTKEGSIEIGFSIIQNAIKFYVKDTGIGIAKDKQEIIFNLFRQLDDSHTREFEGVGIGLSIAKSLCENLGGKMSLESELNRGSTFYFTIPYETEKEETAKIKDASNERNILSGKTILIAEDDISSFELLKMYLTPLNANVLWARNGIEAIKIFKKNKSIDLVLMDIKMPALSGYVAAKEIKKISPLIPIIAQTAYAFENEKTIALEAGCDDYVSKPISWPILFNKIIIHLQKAERQINTSEI